MLDIRYHIVSICAVFMMLGIGILIGERIAAPAQMKQQTRSLAALKAQVDGAVQDGREAKRRLVHLEDAVDILRKHIVPDKLAGKRVIIIQASDFPQATNAAGAALADSGATVAATVVISDRFLALSPDARASLIERLSAAGGAASPPDRTPGDAPLDDVFAPLLQILHTGTGTDSAHLSVLSMLLDDRYIAVSGDLTQPCSLFVLVGGRNDDGIPSDSGAAEAEASIIKGLTAGGAGVTVVGCEPIDVAGSSIPTYQKAGIASIDCIDIPLGQLDLPYALRGGPDETDYGLKSTAAHTLPPSLEEQTHP